MQVQLRDYRGHHETRRLMLTSNPKLPTNWVGFAVAHHLAGNHRMSLAVLDQYQATLDSSSAMPRYELSELYLFRLRVMEAAGETPRALLAAATRPVFALAIADQLAYQEKVASLLLAAGRAPDAAGVYAGLLAINSENYGYHRGLQTALLGAAVPAPAPGAGGCELPSNASARGAPPLPSSAVDALLALYLRLAATYPRSRAVRRIPLDLLPPEHPAFGPLLAAYALAGVRKGLPSLFADLKSLVRAPGARGLGWAARQATRGGAPPTAKAAAPSLELIPCHPEFLRS